MVSKVRNWKLILAAVLLLVVVGVAFAVFTSPEGEPDGALSAIRKVVTPNEEADADDSAGDADLGSDSATPLTGTEGQTGSTTRTRKPNASGAPVPPAAGPSAAELWQQYLVETKAVVDNGKPDLTAMIAAVTQALSNGDEAALTGMLAPDEGNQSAYVGDLASKYPTILDSTPGANVNIYTCAGETIYFGYSVVTWTDAGIVSQHTIPRHRLRPAIRSDGNAVDEGREGHGQHTVHGGGLDEGACRDDHGQTGAGARTGARSRAVPHRVGPCRNAHRPAVH
jgi:hypothetical protein